MALVPNIYLDAALLNQFDDASDSLYAAAKQGSNGVGVFYVGTHIATDKVQAASDPGIDPITVDIFDANVGSGVEAAHYKLATSQAGLASATPGAQLSLGAEILGGPGGAVPVWYQWDNSTGGGVDTDIGFDLPARIDVAQ